MPRRRHSLERSGFCAVRGERTTINGLSAISGEPQRRMDGLIYGDKSGTGSHARQHVSDSLCARRTQDISPEGYRLAP